MPGAADSSGQLSATLAGLVGHDLDGRYRIDALLGVGGMGAVVRARHTFTEQAVAIKLLRPSLARDPAAARRFAREARGTCYVESEHAVKVSDFGVTADGLPYMVLELLDGHTVGAELAREGRLAPRRAVHVARQVALALAAAHQVGLIHRDLKPDNVMLIRRGGDPDFAKVLDFGLVKVMEGAGERALSMAALTQGDLVFGTPDYMAPEQALGQPLDHRADLYALGATLFEMLTGQPPFPADSAMEVLVAHVQAPVPSLAVVMPAADPALTRLCARLLAKDRERRPATAAEVADELAGIERRLAGPAHRAQAATVELPGSAVAAAVGGLPARDVATAPTAALTPARLAGVTGASPLVGSELTAWPADAAGITGTTDVTGITDDADARDADQPLADPAGQRRRALVALVVMGALGLAALVWLLSRGDGARPAAAPTPDARAAAVAPPDAGALDAAPTAVAALDAGTVDATTAPAPATGPRDDAAIGRYLAAAEQARKAGNPLRQLAMADSALELDPRHPRARFLVGDALVTTGDRARGCRLLLGLPRLAAARARAREAGCPGAPAD